MKKFALVLAAATLLAAPMAAQDARSTDLLDEGKSVDSLLLRYHFEALWALDKQNLILLDSYREHYQITTDKECQFLDKPRALHFVPKLEDRVRTSLSYEVRDDRGQICDIAKIAKIPREEAKAKIATLGDKG